MALETELTAETPEPGGQCSALWLLVLVPLAAAGGWLASHLPLRPYGLTVAAAGWVCLRLCVSRSARESVVAVVARLAGAAAAAVFCGVLCLLLAGAVWQILQQLGIKEVWELLKQDYARIVPAGLGLSLIVVFATGLVTGVAFLALDLLVSVLLGRPRGPGQTLKEAKAGDEAPIYPPGTALVVLGSDLIPLCWFLLFLSGRDLVQALVSLRLPEAAFSYLPAAVGMLAALVAWLEGDRNSPLSLVPARSVLAAGAALAHFQAVRGAAFATYDWAIRCLVMPLPVSLWIALPIAASLACALLVLGVLSLSILWRYEPMNRRALRVLSRYLGCDARGLWHARIRHVGHLLAHRFSPARWLWLAASWPVRQALRGDHPPRVPASPPARPPRYEQFVRQRLEAQRRKTLARVRRYRSLHLLGEESSQALEQVGEAARRQAESLLALADFLQCPHAPCRNVLSDEGAWELAEWSDRLLIAAGETANAGDPLWRALRRRLDRWYAQLMASPGLGGLVRFRRAIIRGHAPDDRWRGDFRDFVLSRLCDGQDVEERFPSPFAVHAVLAELRDANDWEGVIEASRRFTLGNYELREEDHLDLGEAYWRHADELGPGELSSWLREKAVSHFYQAGNVYLLDQLSPSNQEATP